MSVIVSHNPGASEEQVIEEMAHNGFEAAAKDYSSGSTEPHHHNYDVCLYILDGEFRLNEVGKETVHCFGRGDRVLVDRGTVHSEEYGQLRMIVGRRH